LTRFMTADNSPVNVRTYIQLHGYKYIQMYYMHVGYVNIIYLICIYVYIHMYINIKLKLILFLLLI
jgi:hypothetical protein